MKKFYLFLHILFIANIFSQVPRETRAVWVSTNFALDWPPKTYDAEIQKESLRNIFENLHDKHFNTVYFQARSNGTVMYNSTIEPFSPYLTGVTGNKPEYDPLEFAIQLGKQYGMEVHAWLNMVRCFAGTNEEILLSPFHIRNIHPEWTRRKMYDNGKLTYWLNPGLFEVQEYLTRIMLEVASNYDVDGIQLDFFRYPGKNFDDDAEYSASGTSLTKDEWRRENLTEILRNFKQRVHPKNPFLKIGVTPIGIRKNLNGANGWEGYYSVYQDSERWLQEELVDYLAPQIYWPFEDNPSFAVLADDWVNKSYGRNIILGLAAYKPEVKSELNEMINFARKIDAAGISVFRYGNIANMNDFYFNEIAFPKNMPWKNDNTNLNNKNLYCFSKPLNNTDVILSWENTTGNDTRYFVLQNLSGKNSLKLLSPAKDHVKLKFANPTKLAYNYRLSKLNRLWDEVATSKDITVQVPYLKYLKESANVSTGAYFIQSSGEKPMISIFSHTSQEIILEIVSKENSITQIKKKIYLGYNLIYLGINVKSAKTIKIFYADGTESDEINFY